MSQFTTGTIVQLKSGGPKMTVQTIGMNGDIWCQWFAGSKAERASFPSSSLKIVDESEDKK